MKTTSCILLIGIMSACSSPEKPKEKALKPGEATKIEKEYLDTVQAPKGEILGKWRDNSPYVESVCFIFIADGKTQMKTSFKDKSEMTEVLIKSSEDGNTRYDAEGDTHGEYYVIEKNGNLGMYGENGKFKEIKKIE